CVHSRAEVVIIKGYYQGKNVYVQNVPLSSGTGYCIYEVLINERPGTDEVNSTSFEIDLGIWYLKLGDPVNLTFRTKERCDVRIVNPDAIYPTSTFELKEMSCNDQGLLRWSTTKEVLPIDFVIEQFKWNKWVVAGGIKGKGLDSSSYEVSVRLTSGQNIFRLYQLDYKGQRMAPEYKYVNPAPPIEIVKTQFSKTLDFSRETGYELYSEFGNLIKNGFGKSIDTSILPAGSYYLSYDNKPGVHVTKK
ncbi:MAG: hypothetical protein ACKOW8_12650, partial [Flavobacteriales bacterium]